MAGTAHHPSSLAWQASLFGASEPAVDTSFAGVTRTELDRGAWIEHGPGWLAGADSLFATLVEEMPWRSRSRWMYDREVAEPRLTAWWNLAESSTGLPPVVLAMRDSLAGRYGVDLDSCGMNLYRDGHDSVAWHGDTVRKTMAEPLVAIVSLGSPRRFLLRPTGGGTSRRFDLRTGDLLVMGGTCQHTWQHSIPKMAAAGSRISVTFRHSR